MSNNEDYYSQPRGGFLTPPPSWRKTRCSPPVMPVSERKPRRPFTDSDPFHVIHKVPSGDSPYVRAKHVQLIDKDPSRAVSLFWAAINSGDRVDSALKDMAVVMKQLDRSDEAIEAVKSFRDLCPFDSQEALDNILVELYKQSGRIEEEIELLQRKVKQVEEGVAFGGKRTKTARSQGKKIQITVEKEYSRLLGNLAWAYMQHKDFKSAEENYRKSLTFEPDKNKQCNLAVCLMHMNKLTEAKFLLQSIISSDNGRVDESYAKSYERASEILAELESERFCNPMIPSEQNNRGAFTDFPCEKRSGSAHHRTYESPICSRGIPKVPVTQPRRCSGGGSFNNGAGYCRKLSFASSTASNKNGLSLVNPNDGDWRKKALDSLDRLKTETEDRHLTNRDPGVENVNNHEMTCWSSTCEVSTCGNKKSWADMVEEDEQRLNDENVDYNIISETPKSLNEVGKLRQEIESIDLEDGYLTQPGKNTNSSVRRSLCFDQNNHKIPDDFSPIETISRRNRLQVFQDITSVSGSH